MGVLKGKISGMSGPTVTVRGMEGARMYTTALVGRDGLLGEIIKIQGDRAILQVYEDTTGLSLGDEVISEGRPLSARLGPGLLSGVFDGIQRPLELLKREGGDFIKKGIRGGTWTEKKWEFIPAIKAGDIVTSGDVIGSVVENERIVHKILVPPGKEGVVKEIRAGEVMSDDPVAILEDNDTLSLFHEWPVRIPRPYRERLVPDSLFLTGQRIFDTLFPLAEGGTAIVPGGFGTGKTVVEQSLARFAASDIIVYVGCGERGNEMTEVLTDFPELLDQSTGLPLILRTILIVNTSNMPVAAREASIFLGVTIAEYFRDMGYRVALMADSISRWAEALREISSRMEEMPGEEGYPPYLASRLAGFFERGGKVRCLGKGDRVGSVTLICAISPPGGDFSEPVTQASVRVAGTLWALDTDLAYRRHFPAVDWNRSFTLYLDTLEDWFRKEVAEDMVALRSRLLEILERDGELKEVVQLIGVEALQDLDRLTIEAGRMIKEVFLRQSIFNEADAYCTMEKQYWMMKCIVSFYERGRDAIQRGVYLEKILRDPLVDSLYRLQDIPIDLIRDRAKGLLEEVARRWT